MNGLIMTSYKNQPAGTEVSIYIKLARGIYFIEVRKGNISKKQEWLIYKVLTLWILKIAIAISNESAVGYRPCLRMTRK